MAMVASDQKVEIISRLKRLHLANEKSPLTFLDDCQRFLKDPVFSRNTAKILAVGVGMMWNFCWYKWFVFER